MSMELILNKKKVRIFLMCLRIFKKSVLKRLDRTVYTACSSVGAYLTTL